MYVYIYIYTHIHIYTYRRGPFQVYLTPGFCPFNILEVVSARAMQNGMAAGLVGVNDYQFDSILSDGIAVSE